MICGQLGNDRRIGLAAASALLGELDAVNEQQLARAMQGEVADVDVLTARNESAAGGDIILRKFVNSRNRPEQIADRQRTGLLEIVIAE